MAQVLITGGAGYLGTILVQRLLQYAHHVTVIDTFAHGSTALAPLAYNPRLTLIRKDARDLATWHDRLKMADVVIPLAALVGAPACERDPTVAKELNAFAVAELVRQLSSEQLLLFPNTNSGYGTTSGDEPCTEETTLRPISAYGITKRHAEGAVLQHPRGVVFRFATLFGGSYRMRLDLMVNDFCYRAVRDKSMTLFSPHVRRNFLHVRDAAAAFLFAIDRNIPAGVYNCGLSSANLTKLQLVEKIQEWVPDFVVHCAPVGEDPDKRDYVVSNAKLEALGWHPMITLGEGIWELVQMFRALPFGIENRNAW